MSLTNLLPAPTQVVWDREDEAREQKLRQRPVSALVKAVVTAPPYGQRRGWVPRNPEDFGDGGAFPEIHVAQYPLGMGMKGKETTSNALAVQLDAQGKIKYDLIARQGHGKDKIVYSKLSDLLPSEITNEEDPTLQRPTDEEIDELTDKTKKALEKITRSKIAAAMPVRCAEKQAPAQYIRYTPSQQGQSFNSGAKQRVIRMVEAQVDPLEPPKFKINKKIPRGPPSPPAPVIHSPTRKVTVKEQKEWKIPPCISNWKNAKGYTIPLDKRLAADGRGLQQVHINENFAKLAEALYIADRKAREAVEMRAQLEKKLAQKEKEKKEDHLRQLAQKAREERAGLKSATALDKAEESRERDQLRQERHKDRARERNLARAAPDKRSRLQRERERDISEQIALGLPAKSIPNTGEAQFDQRLFNTSKGMDSGYGHDDEYNVYDKPWKDSNCFASHIYLPSKNIDKDTYGDDLEKLVKTNRFVPDKEFSGTDRSATRSGPVQFEKDEEDPFGLDQFLKQAKRASSSTTTTNKRSRDDRDKRDDREKRRKH
ncbi:PREDICTED: puff-specific protein Bx42 [Dinoponera quadriceps]|uniref:Puff-specific protein Bx42 n=1 Tax=Dinoponera quadriceps TaxID=609295 RepID=A0A6P3XYL5_DINQU|nr:PREDICTED: puff-specific protein Bx42 [Dinoponera quadriceps]